MRKADIRNELIGPRRGRLSAGSEPYYLRIAVDLEYALINGKAGRITNQRSQALCGSEPDGQCNGAHPASLTRETGRTHVRSRTPYDDTCGAASGVVISV